MIQITQEHIDNGKRAECSLCPIALAIKKVIKSDLNVGTGYGNIWISGHEVDWYTKTPEVARVFMFQFDRQYSVKPTKFELDIPCVLVA